MIGSKKIDLHPRGTYLSPFTGQDVSWGNIILILFLYVLAVLFIPYVLDFAVSMFSQSGARSIYFFDPAEYGGLLGAIFFTVQSLFIFVLPIAAIWIFAQCLAASRTLQRSLTAWPKFRWNRLAVLCVISALAFGAYMGGSVYLDAMPQGSLDEDLSFLERADLSYQFSPLNWAINGSLNSFWGFALNIAEVGLLVGFVSQVLARKDNLSPLSSLACSGVLFAIVQIYFYPQAAYLPSHLGTIALLWVAIIRDDGVETVLGAWLGIALVQNFIIGPLYPGAVATSLLHTGPDYITPRYIGADIFVDIICIIYVWKTGRLAPKDDTFD